MTYLNKNLFFKKKNLSSTKKKSLYIIINNSTEVFYLLFKLLNIFSNFSNYYEKLYLSAI